MAFTYFFRDLETLELVRQHVVPALKGRRYIDIWDAGCAMGPEPYSLAILVRESMGMFGFRNVRLFATDHDESGNFGAIIAAGTYPAEQIQRVPEAIRAQYFQPADKAGTRFLVRQDIRECVRFHKHDLLSLEPVRTGLGLVLCKNVLLHFTPAQRSAVIRMFHGALGPGGFLVTEQTQKLPPDVDGLFEPVVGNAQIHRKREVAAA